jgi:hypothetical protein
VYEHARGFDANAFVVGFDGRLVYLLRAVDAEGDVLYDPGDLLRAIFGNVTAPFGEFCASDPWWPTLSVRSILDFGSDRLSCCTSLPTAVASTAVIQRRAARRLFAAP